MFLRALPVAIAGFLFLTACSGDDSATTTTTTEAPAPEPEVVVTTTTPPESTTTTTTTVPITLEGATVVVANSSIVGGSAGRMTDELGVVGFTTGTATDGVERLEDSIVYYVPGDDDALAVAESVALKLGGVEVAELPDPIPTESGTLDDAQVLVLLGNNQADRTIEQLSGSGGGQLPNTGSTVVVANTSGVSGSAGRMSAALERAGFDVADATNGVEQRADSIVYYTDAENAMADAETLAAALGGIEVAPMPDEIPTEDGELAGQILLLLGTNQADQSLETLNP